eukprot:5185985-Ditylum_brightwellii.AAC.1
MNGKATDWQHSNNDLPVLAYSADGTLQWMIETLSVLHHSITSPAQTTSQQDLIQIPKWEELLFSKIYICASPFEIVQQLLSVFRTKTIMGSDGSIDQDTMLFG